MLLFDEPLSNLDAKLRRHVREEIHELQRSLLLTAVYVTHDQQEALAICDRIMVMSMARIAQDGTPRGLYEQPNSRFVADFIGDANIVPVTIESRQGEMASVRLGPLLLALPHHGAVEGAAELSIRPHALLLAPRGGGLSGRITKAGLSRQPHGILGDGRGVGQGAVRRRTGRRVTLGGWKRGFDLACPYRRRTRSWALTRPDAKVGVRAFMPHASGSARPVISSGSGRIGTAGRPWAGPVHHAPMHQTTGSGWAGAGRRGGCQQRRQRCGSRAGGRSLEHPLAYVLEQVGQAAATG